MSVKQSFKFARVANDSLGLSSANVSEMSPGSDGDQQMTIEKKMTELWIRKEASEP